MAKIFSNILDTIGNTPIVELKKVVPAGTKHRYFAKLEYFNPGGSVKDRIALSLIEGAERDGRLKPGGTIIEATSGNTGMGLALVAVVKGYKAIFVMHDKISEEKRAILRAFGAKVVITPTAVEPEDPRSYLSVANKLVEITPNSILTNQYHNPDNPRQHFETTGPEIWEQMDGQIDAFFAGAGTGGTISGVGRFLKSKNPDIQIVCPDPEGSILYDLFYHKKVVEPPRAYKVEGVGEDMLPDNVHLDVMDGFVKVSDKESFLMTRDIVAKEGICVGPSSAMALVGAFKYAEKNFKEPKRILVMMPDSGRSYLSKAFNDNWMKENDFLPSPLKSQTVADLLAAKPYQDVITGDVGDSVLIAVEKLKKHSISQLPVFSGDTLVGVLDETDLLLPLATGQLKPEEPILHLIQGSVVWVNLFDDLQKLSEHFSQGYVALVKDAQDRLRILTKIDLLDFLGGQKYQ
jgi:cystathionine beta-synthase